MNWGWHVRLWLLLLMCSGVSAVQTQPRDLVRILKESPFLAVITVTSTDMITPACFRHRLAIDNKIKGVIPEGPIWSNEAFRVGHRYLVFNSRRDSKQRLGSNECESRGWYIYGFGVGDGLPFSDPFPSLDFQDGWIVVPYGFYEIAAADNVEFRERRSRIVNRLERRIDDDATELLINWPDILRNVTE